MTTFPRLTEYIGRDAEKQMLINLTTSIAADRSCQAIYFEAGGGLGKTYLLETYAALADAQGLEVYVAELIDLIRFEMRSQDRIEQHLIDGLKQPHVPGRRGIDAASVDIAFQPYYAAFQEYTALRASDEKTIRQQLRHLRGTFARCWNTLAEQRPLVIRFDTIETLYSLQEPPTGALVRADEATNGAQQVSDWLEYMLAQLHRTLVIICGRPLPKGSPLIEALQQANLPIQVQRLRPLEQLPDIKAYLVAYGVNLPDERLLHVQRMTDGLPLLLTCYAEMFRSDGIPPIPNLPIANPDKILDSRAFRDTIVDLILNPLDRQDTSEATLIFCLYFLACARRGLRRADLHELFKLCGIEYDRRVIDNRLDHLALVKRLPDLQADPTITPHVQAPASQDDERLALHDEIYTILDASQLATSLGIYEPTINYLCDTSRAAVRGTNTGTPLLTAMISHMYYEMVRDVARGGYRTYTIYLDWLLGERSVDDAILLSDAFWITLHTAIEREGIIIYPFRDQLKESPLEEQEIIRDEQVRWLKLLRARDQNTEALEVAERLRQTFVEQGEMTADNQPGEDLYLFVDFNIVRANLLAQVQPPGYEATAEVLFERIIEQLQQFDTPEHGLMLLRRWFFLGQAYNLRGWFRRQQQRFKEAMSDYAAARTAFRNYQEVPIIEPNGSRHAPPEQLLNDHSADEMGQVTNNLAYALALSGNFKRAIRLSHEVITVWIKHVLPYQRALFYNTNALILIRAGKWQEAEPSIIQAEQVASDSGRARARGLVQHTRGRFEYEKMLSRRRPNPECANFFAEAARLLPNDRNALYEVYFDWSRFARDIADIYEQSNDITHAEAYRQIALEKLDAAEHELAVSPAMQQAQADLLEARAIEFNSLQDYDRAKVALDQAEQLLVGNVLSEYGQVVSGKIALQRGRILIYRDHDYQSGLQLLAIALARAYVFAREHHDQARFEELIVKWLADIPSTELHTFRQAVQRDQIFVHAGELPYQKPSEELWAIAWEESTEFINDHIT